MDIERKDLLRKRKIRRALGTVCAAAALGGAAWGVSRLEPAAPSVERAAVFIDKVSRGRMVLDVRGLGSLVPEEIVLIPARDEGRVERRLAQPGAAVEPHTVLLELSNPQLEQQVFDAESEIAAAEAEYRNLEVQLQTQTLDQEAVRAQVVGDYEQARVQYEADKELFDEGLKVSIELAKSRVAYEQMEVRKRVEEKRLAIREKAVEAQLAAQRARIDQSRRLLDLRRGQLARLKVRAGMAGVLQQLEVEVGELVAPGAVLARVSDPNRLKAALKIPETQAKDIVVGQPAEIDMRTASIAGSVARIDPAVRAGAVTVDVRLEGELPKGARPDLSVDGRIILDRIDDALQVGRPVYAQPNGAVSLFRLAPDGVHAARSQVRIGRASVNKVEILGGLAENDEVILSDMSAWQDYERIRLN